MKVSPLEIFLKMIVNFSKIPKEVLKILDSAYITVSNTPEPIITFDAEIYLFDITNPKYKGVAVKRMKPTNNPELKRKRDKLLKSEFEAFNKFQKAGFYQDSERIPEIIDYDQKNSILLEERIYEDDILTNIQKRPESASYFGGRVADWLFKLHRYNQNEKNMLVNQTSVYKEFIEKLNSDKKIFDNLSNELYSNIKNSVETIGEHEFNSIEANLHGDPSPIHFFYIEKDNIYGIDFNASTYDTIYKDCGTLVSNSYAWLINTEKGYKKFTNFIEGFKRRYKFKSDRELDGKIFNFCVAKSEYDKARWENLSGNSEVSINYLNRIDKLLTSPKFSTKSFNN